MRTPSHRRGHAWRAVQPILWVFLVTTFIGAIQLYVRYDSTDITFAWTIEPPLSAAFLGAGTQQASCSPR